MPRTTENVGEGVHGLVRGRAYRVVGAVTDFHGNRFEPGETLTFRARHFLPYHGGHTLFFTERAIYLQQDANAEFLENLACCLERAGAQQA